MPLMGYNERTSNFDLRSGGYLGPCAEFVGIDPESERIAIGYDGVEGYARDYTDEEREEIADEMIRRWTRFKEGVPASV